jgi:hypothetical protein
VLSVEAESTTTERCGLSVCAATARKHSVQRSPAFRVGMTNPTRMDALVLPKMVYRIIAVHRPILSYAQTRFDTSVVSEYRGLSACENRFDHSTVRVGYTFRVYRTILGMEVPLTPSGHTKGQKTYSNGLPK